MSTGYNELKKEKRTGIRFIPWSILEERIVIYLRANVIYAFERFD